MFEWYRCAQVCYAYLSDVSPRAKDHHRIDSDFRRSKWFTRGWTLQELLAPHWIQFFDEEWTEIGTKSSLQDLITSITGISHLFNFHDASVAQKMCWASKRETTRLEDQAYCLMGLFGVKMPPLYGEGRHAFMRLQSEIINKTDDETIFAWMRPEGFRSSGLIDETGMLAPSPAYFERSGHVRTFLFDHDRPPHTMTNKGLRLELLSFEASKGVEVIAPLNAADNNSDNALALRLWKSHTSYSRSAELYHIQMNSLNAVPLRRGVFFVGQAPDNPPSPFPQKVVFNIQNMQFFGFSLLERQVYPIAGCAYWIWEQHDRRGPTLHRFKPYWQRAAVVLEKRNYATLIVMLGISKENHLWVDVIQQRQTPDGRLLTTDFPEDGNTDRISRMLPDGYSVTVILKKDHSLGQEGYVLEATLDPDGALPWPSTRRRSNASYSSTPSIGLESKPFNPGQVYMPEKSPTQVSRVLSAISLGSSKSKPDRKSSYGFSK
jgi:hypothetical protein